MGKSPDKIWEELLRHQRNVRFKDFCRVIEWFGFDKKGGKGSHLTYYLSGVREILDVQSFGSEAKPYQIKQLINVVKLYGLKGGKNA